VNPRISHRGRLVPASPIRKLVPLADQAKRRGVQVLHLNIGQPDIETPLPMRRRLSGLEDKIYAYTPSGGTPEYLGFLKGYYAQMGIPLELGNLVATTGGSEAILFSMLACASEGDDILVVEPFYTNYAAFAAMTGLRLIPVTSRGEDGFHLPPRAEWDHALTPKTRLVLLCNPNNPTGTVYSRDELKMVADFCAHHGLFLVVDEVYREFVYDGRESVSALGLAGFEELVLVVDSLSKRYSACGIRLGCLVTRNKEVYDASLRMAQGRLSAPGLAQLVALGAAELGPDYTRSIVAEYEARRDLLFEGLGTIPGVFLRKPEGAFYFVARLPVSDSEDFARWLLTDFESEGTTLMVAPAAGFYASPGMGTSEVRLAYVLGHESLRRAVLVLKEALERYRDDRDRRGQPQEDKGPDFHLPVDG
jgi:aspartate aminotransferase